MKILQWSTFAGACILASAAIGYNLQGKNDAQLAALAGAWGLSVVSAYAEHQAQEPDQMLQMVKRARLDLFEQLLDRRCHQVYDAATVETKALPPTQEQPITPLESVGAQGVGIAVLGNSGSGKSSIVQWLIGFSQPNDLIILDPHNDGKTWGQLPVFDNYEQILVKLSGLLEELDRRRELKKQGKSITPMMIIGDEWPSIRAYAKKQKSDICDDFILRMGCEARKYKMLSIICNHSGNVKAMGLEGQGDFLENWCLVRLGKVAKKYAKNMSDRRIAATIISQAYPCLINDELSYHPTHGHYQQFQNEQPPAGIKPYRAALSTEPLTNHNQSDNSSFSLTNKQLHEYLERMYQLESENGVRERSDISDDSEPSCNDIEPLNLIKRENVHPSDHSVQGSGDGQIMGARLPENLTLELAAKVLKLKQTGKTKAQIILSVWQAKKGGSKAYQQANQDFEAIKSYWNCLELW